MCQLLEGLPFPFGDVEPLGGLEETWVVKGSSCFGPGDQDNSSGASFDGNGNLGQVRMQLAPGTSHKRTCQLLRLPRGCSKGAVAVVPG